MQLILKTDRAEVWQIDGEFWVYGVTADPRVLPSEALARSFAAGA